MYYLFENKKTCMPFNLCGSPENGKGKREK